MNDKEIMQLVSKTVGELDEIRAGLTKLSLENEDLFESYNELVSMYNDKWDAIRNLLKEVEGSDGISIGAFSRDRKKVTTKYKPSLLPNEVLTAPGVVSAVDDKKIAELVAAGVIAQHEVEEATYAYSRSPSVRSDIKRAQLPTLKMSNG